MYQDIVLDGIPGQIIIFKTLGHYICVTLTCLGIFGQNASESSLCFNFLPFGEVRPVSDSLRLLGTEHELFSAESAGRSQEVTVKESQTAM